MPLKPTPRQLVWGRPRHRRRHPSAGGSEAEPLSGSVPRPHCGACKWPPSRAGASGMGAPKRHNARPPRGAHGARLPPPPPPSTAGPKKAVSILGAHLETASRAQPPQSTGRGGGGGGGAGSRHYRRVGGARRRQAACRPPPPRWGAPRRAGAPRAPPPPLATAAGGGGAAARAPPAVAPVPLTRVVDAQSARSVAGMAAAVRPAGDGGSGGRALRAVGGVGGAGRHPWRGRLPKETGGGTAALALAKTSAAAPPHGARRHLTLARGWGAPMRGGGEGGAPFVSPPLRRWYARRKTKWLQVRCAATAGLKKLAPSWQQQCDVENVDV